jgi:beta-lactam-binding protein with PASTA domain
MIALIVVICILIATIAGVGLYLLLGRDKSSGSSSGSNNAAATTEATTEEVTDDTTEATEDTTASEVKKIRIPDVSELDLYDAEQLLERLGFVVDTEYEFSDTVPKDKIISLSPEAGNEEDQGTRITIKLSKGAEKRDDITAPDVRSDNYADAKEKLEKLGFKVSVTYEAGSPETKDQVISQSVPAKTVVPYGTSILIVVSDGTKSSSNDQSHRYGKVITEETDLNIRRSPDINSDIIGTAKKGSTVEILGEENGWFKISYNNGVGYVSMAYVIAD